MRKGQSTVEFAMFIAIIIAALLTMAPYVKRAFQGQYRSRSDELGEQYDPKNTSSDITTTRDSLSVTTSDMYTVETKDGNFTISTARTDEDHDTSNRSGTETVGPIGKSLFK